MNILSVEASVLLITIILLFIYRLHKKWQFLAKHEFPHLKPKIYNLGSGRIIFDPKTLFEIDNEMKKKFGPVWGYYSATMPFVVVHDPDILRKIYVKEFSSFPDRQDRFRKIQGRVLNESLFNVLGSQWKRQRMTMTPTYSSAKLRGMTGIIESCVDDSFLVLDENIKCRDGTTDPKEVFAPLALDIALSAGFSTKARSHSSGGVEQEIVKQAKKLLEASFMGRFFFFCFLFPPFEKAVEILGLSLFPRESLEYFTELTKQIVKEREENPNDQQGRVDLMQLLLDSKVAESDLKKDGTQGMTEVEVIGNAVLSLLAGYDNTSNTMSFFAYNMAFYPEAQKKLQSEIDEMMHTHGKFDMEGLSKLKYLEMCLNETLRLYMPLFRNQRVCQKEVTINGYTFPKGIYISIPAFALAHDPDYWDEPYEFKPERMEDMSQIDNMMFQPFGAGPRNCIGMRFAMLEMKMVMAKFFHKYTILPAENTPKPPLNLEFKIAVRPAQEFSLRVIPRETEATS